MGSGNREVSNILRRFQWWGSGSEEEVKRKSGQTWLGWMESKEKAVGVWQRVD